MITKENAKEYLPILQAVAEGKIIQCNDHKGGDWEDLGDRGLVFALAPGHYRVKPEVRYMTREEVLGFLASHTRIVVRYTDGLWQLPGTHRIATEQIDNYEWAYIGENGDIGEPRKFRRATSVDCTPEHF